MNYNLAITSPRDIPVVFHILYASDGTGLHADSTLHLAVDSLNLAFEDEPLVSFYLAGVNRVQNNTWFYGLDDYDPAIANALSVDTRHVLNIIVGDSQCCGGYVYISAPPEDPLDVVFLDYPHLPGYHPWHVAPPRE